MFWSFSANGQRDSVDVQVEPPRESTAGGKTIEPRVELRVVGPDGNEGYMVVTLSADEADRLSSQLATAAADARELFG